MAINWVETPRTRRFLAAFDRVIGLPFRLARRLTRGRRPANDSPERIVVLEAWALGDVVMASAALASLRGAYPAARLVLLAQSHASELLRHSGLVDEVIEFEFPWTAREGKYRLSRYSPRAWLALLRRLRAERFDLWLDARTDVRNNLVAWLSGARRRVGFAHGGGAFFLTDAVPAGDLASTHKIEDWYRLLRHAGVAAAEAPRLAVTDAERAWAREHLAALGIDEDAVVVGVHPGASHAVKRWSPQGFADVADALATRHASRTLVFVDPSGYGADLPVREGAAFVRPDLRQLLALIERCDVLVCNDSGPMHVGAALDVPVVAVFTASTAAHFAPWGDAHRVVTQADLTCRPCFFHCVFEEPYCNTRVELATVRRAADALLAGVLARRVPAEAARV